MSVFDWMLTVGSLVLTAYVVGRTLWKLVGNTHGNSDNATSATTPLERHGNNLPASASASISEEFTGIPTTDLELIIIAHGIGQGRHKTDILNDLGYRGRRYQDGVALYDEVIGIIGNNNLVNQ